MPTDLSRIQDLENRFDEVSRTMQLLDDAIDKYLACTGSIKLLRRYMSSGDWLADYEADERGEIPPGIKRGILSEDGLYNLLEEVDRIRKRARAALAKSR